MIAAPENRLDSPQMITKLPSMPGIKQIERIIRILQRLSLGREVTINKLHDYFDRKVPKRTLQRDLIEISAANIPLMTRKGQGKELVWYLDSSFLRFIPATIGSRELLASFFLKRLASVAKGTDLEADITSLLDKSKQLVSPEYFATLDEPDISQGLFAATFTGYIDYGSHSQTIEAIISAARECRRCKIVYKATWKKEKSILDSEPYLLLYHKGALYAVVYSQDKSTYLFLPIQRIRRITLLDEIFIRDPKFSLESLRQGRFGIFGFEGMKPEKVVLKFSKEIAEVVAERNWHPSQKLKRHRDGSLTMELKVVISDELRSWIASWLGYVVVVRPMVRFSRDNTVC